MLVSEWQEENGDVKGRKWWNTGKDEDEEDALGIDVDSIRSDWDSALGDWKDNKPNWDDWYGDQGW